MCVREWVAAGAEKIVAATAASVLLAAAAARCSLGTTAQRAQRAVLLVPCRTALLGKFPLNGTYFQVNEVFLDHSTLREEASLRVRTHA
jgi:RRM in Demeter